MKKSSHSGPAARITFGMLFFLLSISLVVFASSNLSAGSQSRSAGQVRTVAIAAATCTTPVTVVSDGTPNDAADMQANHDIVSTSACTTSANPDNVYFTIKIQSLSAPLTPDSFYFTTFTIDGVPEAAGSVFGVRMVMDSTGTVPTFQSYTAGASSSGAVDGRFAASTFPANPASNFTPDGTITIIANLSHLGVPVGTHTLT